MATFMEAMQAAREGKRVRTSDSGWTEFKNGTLADAIRCIPVPLTIQLLESNWIIEQPPPREYTFMEAVEMMEKSGKSFTPKGTSPGFIYIDLVEYEYKQRINSTGQGYYSTKFKHDRGGHGKIQEIEDWMPSISDIKGKWIEVKP